MVVGMAILVTLDLSPDTGSDSTKDVPLWKVMLILPLVEEFVFRLPLRRKRWIWTVWAGITAFMITTLASGLKIYDMESLVWRLPVAMVVAGWMGWLGWKWMKKIPFRMRRIIKHKVFEGKSWGEVASLMGRKCTKESVRKEFESFMKSI